MTKEIRLDEKRWLTEETCEHGRYGYLFWVNHGDQDCGGGVRTCKEAHHAGPAWEVIQEEPLTLTPSVLMHCQHGQEHGFVRAGKWESC